MYSPDYKKFIISPDTTLIAAMKRISASSERTLFIEDAEKLIGSITDGDIRRAILNGMPFESLISDFMNKNPRFIFKSDQELQNKAKNYLLNDRLQAIPILDDTKSIIDILFWHQLLDKPFPKINTPQKVTSPVIIMAGGKGLRLDPFTKILPKPLIPIGDKPIIERIMDIFYGNGFSQFKLILNYKKEFIKTYFKENVLPYQVEWMEENEYLGTAGGLSLLKRELKETFIVTNCDIILEADFQNILQWHKEQKAIMTIIGYHKEMSIPYGTLEINKGILKSLNEKPKLDLIINTGIYVMEPQILELIPKDQLLNMNTLIEKIYKERKVVVYPSFDHWFDLGQWSEYQESLYLLNKNIFSNSDNLNV